MSGNQTQIGDMKPEHPSVFIQDEMDARDWDRTALAFTIAGDPRLNMLALDFYFDVGPDEPDLRIGTMAGDIAKAFDVSEGMLLNLESAWLAAQTKGADL